jgi:hypothetical protein
MFCQVPLLPWSARTGAAVCQQDPSPLSPICVQVTLLLEVFIEIKYKVILHLKPKKSTRSTYIYVNRKYNDGWGGEVGKCELII